VCVCVCIYIGKRSAPLPCPLVVETCEKDAHLVGCRFENGKGTTDRLLDYYRTSSSILVL